MNSDIQNTLYGVMHREMVTAPPPFVPEISVGGTSLLDQMDRAFQRGVMLRQAMEAARLIISAMDASAESIEKTVRDLSQLRLVQNINQKEVSSLMFAIAAAAVMEAAQKGNQTALEKLEGALSILSERYQVDW